MNNEHDAARLARMMREFVQRCCARKIIFVGVSAAVVLLTIFLSFMFTSGWKRSTNSSAILPDIVPILPCDEPSFMPSFNTPKDPSPPEKLAYTSSLSPSAVLTASPGSLRPSTTPSLTTDDPSSPPSLDPSWRPSSDLPTSKPSWVLSYNPSNSPADASSVIDEVYTRFGSFVVLETLSHDATSYTQGLQLIAPQLSIDSGNFTQTLAFWESTGLYGRSVVRRVEYSESEDGAGVIIKIPKVVEEHTLADEYFGEGITYFTIFDAELGFERELLLQITWRERTAFVYDAISLEVLQEFFYETTTKQGWGITYDDENSVFYVSDGSQYIHVWKINTADQGSASESLQLDYEQIERFEVNQLLQDASSPEIIMRLNELEWDQSTKTIFANVYQTNKILQIDPSTGRVLTTFDMTTLRPRQSPGDVLNGIALADRTGKKREFWITGKLWPLMYRIRISDRV